MLRVVLAPCPQVFNLLYVIVVDQVHYSSVNSNLNDGSGIGSGHMVIGGVKIFWKFYLS